MQKCWCQANIRCVNITEDERIQSTLLIHSADNQFTEQLHSTNRLKVSVLLQRAKYTVDFTQSPIFQSYKKKRIFFVWPFLVIFSFMEVKEYERGLLILKFLNFLPQQYPFCLYSIHLQSCNLISNKSCNLAQNLINLTGLKIEKISHVVLSSITFLKRCQFHESRTTGCF
jgi:hypothetical protein